LIFDKRDTWQTTNVTNDIIRDVIDKNPIWPKMATLFQWRHRRLKFY